MPRLAASLPALAVSAALALALASCGGSDAKLLPGDTAREIRENLDSVQTLVEEGECVGAEDQALQVSSQVEAVEGIDPNLKRALEEGAARLSEVVEQCEAAPEETVEETVPTTPEKSEAEKAKQEEQREKEEGKQEKEEEKAEKEQEKEAQEGPEGPSLPPQANGKAKGHEEEPPVESGGSGGIGPGGEVEGGG